MDFSLDTPYTTKVYATNGEDSDKVSITFNFKEYLLDTNWNQSPYYNKYIPVTGDDGRKAIVGCVQVTLAQIMKHNNTISTKGNGTIIHNAPVLETNDTKVIKAVFNRTYNWQNMPNLLTSQTPTYQVDEVAYLLKDLVALNNASISTGLTLAVLKLDNIVQRFNYSTTIKTINDADSDISRELILSTIEEQVGLGYPMRIAMNGINGSGHSFNADGYKIENGIKMVHLNLGWAGSKNGWYNLESTAPLFGNADGQYDLSREEIRLTYNIKPCGLDGADDCYSTNTIEDTDTFFGNTFTGTLHGEESIDKDIFELYLKGPTSLEYQNGIFAELFDDNMNYLDGGYNDNIEIDLNSSKYFMRFSTKSYTGSAFSNNYKDYSYDITTTQLTNTEKTTYLDTFAKSVIIDMNISDMIITKDIKKVLIYAYDENDEDNITFSASSSNSDISVSFENNILVIDPQSLDQSADITVTVSSTDGTSDSKVFKLLVTENTMTGSDYSFTGNFASKEEEDIYEIPLKGICEIKLIRDTYIKTSPYSFLQLRNSSDDIIRDYDSTNIITANIEENTYKVLLGLKNQSTGSAYGYTSGASSNNYTINVSCPSISNDIKSIANSLNISNSW